MLLTENLGAELAGGESAQGSEAGAEVVAGQAALAVEASQKVGGGEVPLAGVAVHAARNEIAVGIGPALGDWEDMVQAVVTAGSVAKTVEAEASFAGVDGQAKRTCSPEVQLFEIRAAGRHRRGARGMVGVRGAKLLWQANVDHMTDVAAFDQVQSSDVNQAADRLPGAPAGNAQIAGQPNNRKAQPELAFKAGVAEQMRVDGTVEDREFEAGCENVFQLFPHFDTIEFFVFHRFVLFRGV